MAAPLVTLDKLYPDLLLRLSLYLVPDDQKVMRQICKALSQTFAFPVWKTIKIRMGQNLVDFLECLSERAALAAPTHAVQEVKFSPVHFVESERMLERERLGDIFSDAFISPLIHLSNVRRVRFEVLQGDHHIANQVAKVVSLFKNLELLDLSLHSCPSLPALRLFRNLRVIKFTTFDEAEPGVTSASDDMGQAIAQSPHLQRLTVSVSGDHLERLLAQCNSQDIRLCYLHTLIIRQCTSPLPLLPHVQNLKVLMVDSVSRPSEEYIEAQELFWAGLINKTVTLDNLIVESVSNGLIQYLKCQKGLKYFKLQDYNKDAGNTTSKMADVFYHEAMESLNSTLRTLVIRLSYEDEWCWRSQVQPYILKCTQLKRLCIGITYLQLKTSSEIIFDSDSEDEEPPSRIKDSSHLHALIDGIATQCPSIRVLELFNTTPSTAMDSATYILRKMSQMLEVTLSSYVAPVEANSIPTIYGEPVRICDKKYFTATFDKELQRYRYKTRDRKL